MCQGLRYLKKEEERKAREKARAMFEPEYNTKGVLEAQKSREKNLGYIHANTVCPLMEVWLFSLWAAQQHAHFWETQSISKVTLSGVFLFWNVKTSVQGHCVEEKGHTDGRSQLFNSAKLPN